MSSLTPRASDPSQPEPVWDIATLYPPQGTWTESGYLSLTASTNRLIEFTDGNVEFLAMPTKAHQLILVYVLEALRRFVADANLGLALPAPLRVRIRETKFREPDIVFIASEHSDRAGNEFFDGADLVIEVVSEDPESRHRDLVEKVLDYAEARIPEYWIIDPAEAKITVLTRPDPTFGYRDAQTYTEAETAASKLLAGFELKTSDVFHAADE